MRTTSLICLMVLVSLLGFALGAQAEPARGEIWTDPATGMEFAWVPGGCYQMGQTADETAWLMSRVDQERYDKSFKDELPRHEVCVDGFWMGRLEVTRGQFREFVRASAYRTDVEKEGVAWISNKSTDWKWKKLPGYDWSNPGFDQTDEHPVVLVSWNDAKAYAQWLSSKSGHTFRLPTEAEWEYAARAGETGKWAWGDDEKAACRYANRVDSGHNWNNAFDCDDGYEFTAPVGHYKPNALGLYDVTGNVWEWCEDVYDAEAYATHERNNPVGGGDGKNRVYRGGSWFADIWYGRLADRNRIWAQRAAYNLGMRLVRTP